ncbi:hypothetical protein KMW28_09620 [Flammeovirga yaeyamensis]|uniref:Uncharacterized protein n=1 Tax=Flammeovirga yaeyamensis TaxID=367791 RepID=A0AAX1N8N3_9BACT|nr:hypothetical protein [Flammeovirga yaeyamensis]MBB3698785.1 hypothetical protein [Flammeovirga yaeyamensis]NMF37370.1 hypothetical protein [Flammeovirga yaeyamensis]QWG03814.1 hypothetical protein KMW28_09620 [Flammeovirga yaeyamensis]
MEQAITDQVICRNCKTPHRYDIENCTVCDFPIYGTDKEQSVFIAKQITQKADVKDSFRKMQLSRNLLFGIGAFNICMALFSLIIEKSFGIELFFGIALGGLFIFFSLLTKKNPLFATGGPIVLYLIYIVALTTIDSRYLTDGVIFKIAFFMILGYGFFSTIKANSILKKNPYLVSLIDKK